MLKKESNKENNKKKMDSMSIKDIADTSENEILTKRSGEVSGKKFIQEERGEFIDEDTTKKAMEIFEIMKENNNGVIFLSTDTDKEYGSQTLGMLMGHNSDRLQIMTTLIMGLKISKGQLLAAYELAQERNNQIDEEVE